MLKSPKQLHFKFKTLFFAQKIRKNDKFTFQRILVAQLATLESRKVSNLYL